MFYIPFYGKISAWPISHIITYGIFTYLYPQYWYHIFFIGIILSLCVSLLLRNQVFVNDNEWLKRMIPHHSTAITTSSNILKNTNNSNIKYSVGKCWVITINEQDIFASNPSQILPWCLQTKSVDGSECSVWNYFSSGTDYICDNPLEWVGDLLDLELSEESIPKYIRSLVKEGETLEDAAKRLS